VFSLPILRAEHVRAGATEMQSEQLLQVHSIHLGQCHRDQDVGEDFVIKGCVMAEANAPSRCYS
jgi:hypothetical protein